MPAIETQKAPQDLDDDDVEVLGHAFARGSGPDAQGVDERALAHAARRYWRRRGRFCAAVWSGEDEETWGRELQALQDLMVQGQWRWGREAFAQALDEYMPEQVRRQVAMQLQMVNGRGRRARSG